MESTRRRASPDSERRGQVEAAVLSATSELLADGRSFPALSVGGIARHAGVGRTTFYFYFSTKTDLLIRLVSDLRDEFSRQGSSWWREGGIKQLNEVLPEAIELLLDHSPVIRAVVDAAPLDPRVASFWHATLERVVDAIVARIERERAAERIDPWYCTEFVRGLVLMTERSCYHFAGEPRGDREAFIRAQTEVWLRALYCRSS